MDLPASHLSVDLKYGPIRACQAVLGCPGSFVVEGAERCRCWQADVRAFEATCTSSGGHICGASEVDDLLDRMRARLKLNHY